MSLHPVGPSWDRFVPSFLFVPLALLTQTKEQEHASLLED